MRKPTRKAHLPRRDDLPFLKSSAARKSGVINPLMDKAEVEIGGHKAVVGLWHRAFPNGGSWSFFTCPSCGRGCRTLRLYDGRFVCSSCDGLLLRCQTGDKAPRIERLRAQLAKPSQRRRYSKTIEIALRRALIVQRSARLKGWPPKP